MKKMTNMSVYVIGLKNNKYFIGTTLNISETLRNIFTKKNYIEYKPLYVDRIYYNCNIEDERRCVMKYITMYGIDNVYNSKID